MGDCGARRRELNRVVLFMALWALVGAAGCACGTMMLSLLNASPIRLRGPGFVGMEITLSLPFQGGLLGITSGCVFRLVLGPLWLQSAARIATLAIALAVPFIIAFVFGVLDL